jgi:hypothetical protein
MEEKQAVEYKAVSAWKKLLSMDKALHDSVLGFFKRYKRIFFPIWISFLLLAILLLFLISFIYAIPAVQEFSYHRNKNNDLTTNFVVDSNALKKEEKTLRREIDLLEKKLDKKTPRSPFLIVNTSKNLFFLYKYKDLIGKGKCSTGSYILLSNGEEQQWIFKTPKGIFTIKGKTTQPVWIKPDWAFVEEGLPIPPVAHSSRYEYGVLGDYALSLGHGYMIHGTLYQRFLGLPVTHGCIRLNDDDLKMVYQHLAIGSKVFIY